MTKAGTRARSALGIGLAGLAYILAGAAGGQQAPGNRVQQGANAAPQRGGNDLHGAMPMAQQQTALDSLMGGRDLTLPPGGVDPVLWSELYVPPDNRSTPERIALGRKLYFDRRLSADGTVACATCHDVSRGFADERMVAEGVGDQLGERNAPTVMNAVFLQSQFWDGRAPTLEEQAKLPIVNPIEMGNADGAAAVANIAGDSEYQRMFQAAYGSAPTYDTVAKAIAAFERTLVFLDSPFDRFLAGDEDAIPAQARRGWELFNGKARCASCHTLNPSNPSGSDSRFHNIGVSARNQNFEMLASQALAALTGQGGIEAVDRLALQTDMTELGRFLVTKDFSDIGAFKTPQLRNIALTAPYMHDGSMRTLWDVMDHYNRGGEANPYLDGGIEPLALNQAEINEIVAFLFALTDDRFADRSREVLALQQEQARAARPFRNEALAQKQVLPFEVEVFGKPTLRAEVEQ